MAFKATTDPNTMYIHEAMKEQDSEDFIGAMHKEVKDQTNNGNFNITHISNVQKGATILPTIWQMKRMRKIRIRKVKSTRLNLCSMDLKWKKKSITIRNICSGSEVEFTLAQFDFIVHIRMAHETIGLCFDDITSASKKTRYT